MLKIKKEELHKWIVIAFIVAISYLIVNNLGSILGGVLTLFSVLKPFVLGVVIAYILNIPMTKIEKLLKNKIKNRDDFIRIISIITSLLLFIGVISFVAFLLIPELVESIQLLMNNIPVLIDKSENFVLTLLDKYPDVQAQIEKAFAKTGNTTDLVSSILNYVINGAVGFISSLVSSLITIFMALIFSVYMLTQKEILIKGLKKLLYAFIKEKYVDKILEVGKLTNTTFNKFISGQCLEAIVLGCLMFIALTIFRFPYALIISVLTAVTALIPIFGALIAMVVGIILIGIINPVQALLFVVVFQIVQQIEGNFIYPRVVGKSVGLSPMWTLLAITVGGNLFGIIGMLVGLPLASVVYSLIRTFVNNKLSDKKLNNI